MDAETTLYQGTQVHEDVLVGVPSVLEPVSRKLGYSNLLCNQRVLHAAIAGLIPQMTFSALEPIMSIRLLDYDISQSMSGLVFGIMPVFLALGCVLCPYIVPKWVEPRITLISSLILLAFSVTLVGPFFTELNLIAMCVGLAL